MKFRILTDTHYEVPDEKLIEVYGTTDHVEVAQIDQENYRDDGSLLYETMADETNETVIYVQPFDPGGQMFTDEAVREFIQIVRMEDLEIHINHDGDSERRVHAKLVGLDGNTLERISLDGYGKTMGFALRDVREQLRNLTGK